MTLYADLEKDRPHWANEEEVRKSWLKHIENTTGIRFHAERGRNDASYNQVCWFPRGTEPVFPPRSEPPLSMVF